MCPLRRITAPAIGARKTPPVARNRGARPALRQAAVITAGSIGLMWFAARISGPCRSRAGTSPETRSRQIGNTRAGEMNSRNRHTVGTRHVVSINAP